MLELSRTAGWWDLQRRRGRLPLPKCLAVHDEYHRIMAVIDRDMKALRDKEISGHGNEDGSHV